MANTPYNVCENWGLRCFEQKVTDKAVILKCSMNSKDKKTGEYTASIYIDVVCSFETCEIAQDEYNGKFINVDGQFRAGGYVNKNGEKVATMSIFASKVTMSQFSK